VAIDSIFLYQKQNVLCRLLACE